MRLSPISMDLRFLSLSNFLPQQEHKNINRGELSYSTPKSLDVLSPKIHMINVETIGNSHLSKGGWLVFSSGSSFYDSGFENI